MNTCGRVRKEAEYHAIIQCYSLSQAHGGALDANDQSKIHCLGLRKLSLYIYILSISRGMCTPSLSPGITLGKVTLQLKQSMKWQTVKLSIGHTPNIWHKNFLLVSGSGWHISVFNTEWSVHHLENNLNKLHCLSKSKVFKESRTVKLNKPRKYERAINNTCEMEAFSFFVISQIWGEGEFW